MPLISIIIPVKNGERTIQKCLDSIQSQTLFYQTEVIVIDSGSTDGTLKILENYSYIQLYHIKSEEFNHGATRNYGVSLSKGDFVVMTVQDAWASSDKWLEIMYNHFKDENVVAVVGQQVVPHEKGVNPHQWYRPVSSPRLIETFYENPEKYLQLSGKEQDECIFYDDVNTMYRRSALLQIPFKRMEFGEDMLWMKTAISKGHKAIYDARSSVWHYHYLSKKYCYKNTFTVTYFKHKVFRYIPEFKIRFEDFILIVYRNLKYKAKLKWVFHNFNILWSRNKAYKEIKKAQNKGDKFLDVLYKKKIDIIDQGKII